MLIKKHYSISVDTTMSSLNEIKKAACPYGPLTQRLISVRNYTLDWPCAFIYHVVPLGFY